MKLKELLNKEILYESIEKFMDRMDTILCYLVCVIGIILVIIQLVK